MNRKLCFSVIFFLFVATLCAQKTGNVVKATLNGLEFIFDGRTGGILKLSYPATGVILQTTADSAGMVDLAYPVKEFEPLRLASRYSKNAKITKAKGSVTIHWEALGASRSLNAFKGNISATVILKEEPDGKSVSMTCAIENHSDHPVPQVVFPDFFGIVPFAGKKETEFRTGGTVTKPFVEMIVKKEHDNFYPLYENMRWFHYGFVLDANNLVIKWMDIGGRKGGLSIYSKNWGVNKGNDEGVYLHLSEITGKLRYMKSLFTDIAPGDSWKSAEYVLTPHKNGWAEGIIPYREYADQHIKKLYPMSDHIRDGLGFRSIWMKTSFYDEDPEGINFKISDLSKVAKESKEHGLDELSLWGWYENMLFPFPPPWKYLGTEEEFASAVLECKNIGVNVAPFVTVMKAGPEDAKRYGISSNQSNYNYDPEFWPRLNPSFAKAGNGFMVPNSNLIWRKEVYASHKHLIDLGITSFCWDQFFSDGSGHYLDTIVSKVREMAKEKDPQSTLSGEVGTNMEYECDYLDYSWNWDYNDKCDYRALLSSLKGPRINLNIDQSVADVKRGFADNLYLNVWPRKPDGINGSDYISNHPDISVALKQCARLRKQFLNYFVNGTFLADCILTKEPTGSHVSAYALPKSMLVIVINQKEKRQINLEGNIAPWLKSSTGRYKIKQYDDGAYIKTTSLKSGIWNPGTPEMDNQDIYFYEIIPE